MGFLTGAALGGIAGLIYALEKGERTMRTAKADTVPEDSGEEERIQDGIREMKEYISGFMEEVNRRFEKVESRL